MALPLVSDVTAAARALIGDTGASGAGEVYIDAVLIPFVQRAYRYAARYMRTKGVSVLRKQSAAIAVTVGQTTLTRPSGATPNYPADMLRPLHLREKQTGGGLVYVQMRMSDGFLPDQPTAAEMGLWDWRLDTVFFIGSTQNRDIQIQYEAELAAVTAAGDSLLIPDSIDALAGLVAAYAAESRDEQTNSDRLQKLAERDLDLLAASELLLRKAAGAKWGTA